MKRIKPFSDVYLVDVGEFEMGENELGLKTFSYKLHDTMCIFHYGCV
jgi:hypothetical protein